MIDRFLVFGVFSNVSIRTIERAQSIDPYPVLNLGAFEPWLAGFMAVLLGLLGLHYAIRGVK